MVSPSIVKKRSRVSSLDPFEYRLAVSKKLMPASIAWRISVRLASSSSDHEG